MTPSSTDPAIDPFAAEIVTDPRQVEVAVTSLHEDAYTRLAHEFEHITAGAPRDRLTGRNALLVLSDAGHGKSHLIGRLFQRFGNDATLIYLRPFQDASSCWIAMLEKVVAELDYPDAPQQRVCDPGDRTQLDTLTRRVLLAIVTKLLRDGKLAHPNKDKALQLFQDHPNEALDMPGWRTWMTQEHDRIIKAMDDELRAHGVQLQPNRSAWLKVLFTYAYSAGKRDVRQLCLDWLTCRPLDETEGQRLRLRRADLPDSDVPYEQRNERAFERLRDLFALGAFYRPFLLCFDQTELYGNSPQLARCFGVVLSRLRRETANHLAVVTSNRTVWEGRLLPNFDEADKAALHPVSIQLRGMTIEQARELVRKRFAQWEIRHDVEEFLARPWLHSLFDKRPERGVRDILRDARQAWHKRPVGPVLEEIFEANRRKLLATPKALDYDPGVLEWAVTQVLGPALEAKAEPVAGPKNYLTVQWFDGKQRTELFGFESGSQWKRWEAILREAGRYHQDGGRSSRVRASFLRLPEQRELPARVLELLKDRKESAHVLMLNLDEAANLFAAHDLWADVTQQNHAVDGERTLAFLRSKLLPIARRIWAEDKGDVGETGASPPPSGLIGLIIKIAQAKRFITLELLHTEIRKALPDVDQTVLLTTAREIKPLRVHSSPGSTVFQWLPQSP